MDIQVSYPLASHSFDSKAIRCGCYVRNPIDLQIAIRKIHVAIPLKHIDYDIQVTNGLVSTTLIQTYLNPTKKFLQIDFSFPINPNACIYRFVAQFSNKRIQGIVKQKQEAKKQYQEALKEGKQAVYAQIDPNSKDIFNMEIGNLAPAEQVKITISYLQELNVELNTFYQLHLPSTISPRYMNDYPSKIIQQHTQSVTGEYTWSFKITLLTSRKLIYYRSPSHELQLISQNEAQTQTILCLSKQQRPNVDLFLLFTVQDFHLPSYVLGRTDLSCTAMLSFIPKFCELSLDDAMKASMVKKQLQTDISAAKGQYVFLLDRSGSMGGTRIQKAKQALTLFLQSLPEDTYFNVVSFGNNSQFMFQNSIKYDKNTLSEAINKIKIMKADMGGTQIQNPLFKIFQNKFIDGYPKQIFLLTDGGVSNTDKVINLVAKQVKYSRCHSIGIGNGCSEALIKGCAEKGKGKYIFIQDHENPSEKIIGLLEQTLTPVIDAVTLKYDKQLVKSIIPNPQSLPYILKNELVNFYITFNGPLEKKISFTFGYKDSMNKVPFQTNIMVDPESQSIPFVDKMAHNKVIKSLQMAVKQNKPVKEYMHYVKVVDKKNEAINHSVKYQILSQYTAFICVNQELVDGKYQQIKDTGTQKVKVQPMVPKQYLQRGEQPQRFKLKQQILDCQSISLKKSCAVKKSSRGFIGGVIGGVVGSVTNFFSSKAPETKKSDISFQRRKVENKKNQYNQGCKPFRERQQYDMMAPNVPTLSLRSLNERSSPQSIPPLLAQIPQSFCAKKNYNQVQKMSFKDKYEKDCAIQMFDEDRLQCQSLEIEPEIKQYRKKKQKRDEKQQNTNNTKSPQLKKSSLIDALNINSVKDVIKEQNTDGSFVNQTLLKAIFPHKYAQILKQAQCKNISTAIAITYVIAKWIELNHPQKQYGLIIKKAFNFIKKSAKLEDLQFMDILIN